MKASFKGLRTLHLKAAAAVTVAMWSAEAMAQSGGSNNMGGVAQNVTTQLGNVGKLMVAGGFVAGLVMLATGLLKLKQAADTQGNQVKYSEGMWRVAVGAGLVAIPAFAGLLTQTFSLGNPGNITPGGGATF